MTSHLLAISDQLSATGAALASIGLSWCILYNAVFGAQGPRLRIGLGIWAGMLILQFIIILVPNLTVHPDHLYGPSG
jgi:hypothetical protein